jgi:hypothetical protein
MEVVMTDYERFKQLLDKYGVEYTEEIYDYETYPRAKVVHLHEGKRKIEGYCNFYCDFCFDKEGNFINIGIFE